MSKSSKTVYGRSRLTGCEALGERHQPRVVSQAGRQAGCGARDTQDDGGDR